MTAPQIVLLVIAALLVVLAGFVAAVESATASFSKVRADEHVRSGRRGAVRLREMLEDPVPYLSTALLVRLALETTATVLVTVVVLDVVPGVGWAVLIAAGVMIVVSFAAVGVGPRTIGRQHADSVALAGSGAIKAMTRVLGPLARLLIMIGNAITPGRGYPEGPFGSEAELRELVDEAEARALIESGEREMIHSVFELGDTIAREVMVPRTDMIFIERNKTLRQFLSLALRSGFSRIPVVGEGGEDDVIGIAYLKDVARRVYDSHESESAERVDSVLRPAVFVPDSKPVDELLAEMQARQNHIVIVVDEYGGTAGLVTIEDILEEIVGEITDEYDTERPAYEMLARGEIRVNARMPVEDLAELIGEDIEDDDVDTVGGLLAKQLGRVPIPGSSVVISGHALTAERVEGRRNRLETVLVHKLEDREPAEAG